MKLTELSPEFLRVTERGTYATVESLADAHGIWFTCPQCREHNVCVWFADRGAPEGEEPTPRWGASGSSFDDLTITPSVNVSGCWHGWVRNGEVS